VRFSRGRYLRPPTPLLVDPDQRTTTMAWTTEDRRRYAPAIQEMVRQGMLARLAATIDAIDPPSPVGRPRIWPTLAMLQALWHVARDDRAWRRLPASSPPHQTVWSRLNSWRRRAVLDRALRVLVACRRLAAGRRRRPTAAIVDTQSVRTGPQRGPRGYDANKKVKGRKRVLMIDAQGDPLGVRVVSADVQDRDALHALAPDLDAHASLLLVWLDRGFAGDDPAAFLRAHGLTPEVVGTIGRKGFQVEPRRWKIEQTFGCLQRYRRLRVDDEITLETSRHMTVLASVFMTGMRLERMLRP
jgi:putative transposase